MRQPIDGVAQDSRTPNRYTHAIPDEQAQESIGDAEIAGIRGTAFSPTPCRCSAATEQLLTLPTPWDESSCV